MRSLVKVGNDFIRGFGVLGLHTHTHRRVCNIVRSMCGLKSVFYSCLAAVKTILWQLKQITPKHYGPFTIII